MARSKTAGRTRNRKVLVLSLAAISLIALVLFDSLPESDEVVVRIKSSETRGISTGVEAQSLNEPESRAEAFSAIGDTVAESQVPADIDPRESLEVLWWPQSPRLTETLVTQALAGGISGIVAMSPVICTNTKCTLELTVTKEQPFFAQISGADRPLELTEAGLGGIAAERLEETPFSEAFSVTFTSYSTVAFGSRDYTETGLTDLPNESIIPCRGRESLPAILGTYQGVEVIQQCICTYDCPNDMQRLISLGIYAGQSCEQSGGVEQRHLAETRYGIRELKICTPEVLVQQSAQ